ncbi:uncharacterized protein LOC115476805 [Microcaecilia unicolor]|uniref:Uncharacterized protein LOC115476805 n=1 Tax=Microcaecilia unicolor TaxID=1415580 RepID=A0A6P7Z1A5_9AMPH|nr:uncharacterized protein LOC115476805 [Microcaecilia unicolor]
MARKATVYGSNGQELYGQPAICDRWKEYTEKLYEDEQQNHLIGKYETLEMEPNILEEEVIWAIKQLANQKAPGIDGRSTELLKPIPVVVLTALCQYIWNTCEWPKEWKKSVFVPIPKKGNSKDCTNYHTIALMPNARKILLKTIQQHLSITIDRELSDVQADFRRGKGTCDHIANIRWIIEKAREYQKDLYMCFIDYLKAFDVLEHNKLWTCLKEIGTPPHLIELIRSFYQDQEATI